MMVAIWSNSVASHLIIFVIRLVVDMQLGLLYIERIRFRRETFPGTRPQGRSWHPLVSAIWTLMRGWKTDDDFEDPLEG